MSACPIVAIPQVRTAQSVDGTHDPCFVLSGKAAGPVADRLVAAALESGLRPVRSKSKVVRPNGSHVRQGGGARALRTDESGATELHCACASGRAGRVVMLLLAGANASIKDGAGFLPADYAVQAGWQAYSSATTHAPLGGGGSCADASDDHSHATAEAPSHISDDSDFGLQWWAQTITEAVGEPKRQEAWAKQYALATSSWYGIIQQAETHTIVKSAPADRKELFDFVCSQTKGGTGRSTDRRAPAATAAHQATAAAAAAHRPASARATFDTVNADESDGSMSSSEDSRLVDSDTAAAGSAGDAAERRSPSVDDRRCERQLLGGEYNGSDGRIVMHSQFCMGGVPIFSSGFLRAHAEARGDGEALLRLLFTYCPAEIAMAPFPRDLRKRVALLRFRRASARQTSAKGLFQYARAGSADGVRRTLHALQCSQASCSGVMAPPWDKCSDLFSDLIPGLSPFQSDSEPAATTADRIASPDREILQLGSLQLPRVGSGPLSAPSSWAGRASEDIRSVEVQRFSTANIEAAKAYYEPPSGDETMERRGVTPLMAAAGHGHQECAAALVKHQNLLGNSGGGWLFDAQDSAGESALHWAVRARHLEIVCLLSAACDLSACNLFGISALHVAAAHGWLNEVGILLHAGADIHCRDMSGCTPLAHAVYRGHDAVAIAMLQWLSRPGMPEHTHARTPLQHALDLLVVSGFGMHVGMLPGSAAAASILLPGKEATGGEQSVGASAERTPPAALFAQRTGHGIRMLMQIGSRMQQLACLTHGPFGGGTSSPWAADYRLARSVCRGEGSRSSLSPERDSLFESHAAVRVYGRSEFSHLDPIHGALLEGGRLDPAVERSAEAHHASLRASRAIGRSSTSSTRVPGMHSWGHAAVRSAWAGTHVHEARAIGLLPRVARQQVANAGMTGMATGARHNLWGTVVEEQPSGEDTQRNRDSFASSENLDRNGEAAALRRGRVLLQAPSCGAVRIQFPPLVPQHRPADAAVASSASAGTDFPQGFQMRHAQIGPAVPGVGYRFGTGRLRRPGGHRAVQRQRHRFAFLAAGGAAGGAAGNDGH